jgi:hypothetical protein
MGYEVILRARPEIGTRVVTGVITAGHQPQYKVAFPTGTQIYSARSVAMAQQSDGPSDDSAELLARSSRERRGIHGPRGPYRAEASKGRKRLFNYPREVALSEERLGG